MRTTLLLLAALLATACGSSSAATSTTEPAETSGAVVVAEPWHCWADATYVSDCSRTATECAESAGDARDMITTPISCAEQPSAWCVTHHLVDEDDTMCLASAASCDGMSNDIVATGGNTVTSVCAETH